jgi:phage FluMu gp28-like protein
MAFEDRSIRVPDDEQVIADLRSIKKTHTTAGNIRFAADRGKNGHADRFWAVALAIHAAADAAGSGPLMMLTRPRTGERAVQDKITERFLPAGELRGALDAY